MDSFIYRGAQEERQRLIEQMEGTATPSPHDEIATIWQDVLEGKWLMVDAFDEFGRKYFVAREAQPGEVTRLSRTERRVLARAGTGESNKQIGYVLRMAESTVATHLKRAFRKLGVASRSQFVSLHAAFSSVHP